MTPPSTVPENKTLGEISEHLTSDDSFLIPHVGKENGKLAINGASIIKNKLWHRDLTPIVYRELAVFLTDMRDEE